jgi:hypothetical protein
MLFILVDLVIMFSCVNLSINELLAYGRGLAYAIWLLGSNVTFEILMAVDASGILIPGSHPW